MQEDGIQTLVVLALALAEELLEPLCHHCECRVVSNQYLNGLALSVKDISDSCVLVAVVIVKISL